MPDKPLARFGEHPAAADSFQQWNPRKLLQPLHLRRHRGRCTPNDLSGTRQRPSLREGDESLQEIGIEGAHSSTLSNEKRKTIQFF
jgi:hypothetical protein